MPSSINIQMFPFDESLEIKLKLQLFYKEQGVRTSAVIDAGIKYKDGCLTLYFEEVLTSKNLDKGLGFFFMKDFGKSDYKVKFYQHKLRNLIDDNKELRRDYLREKI